MTAIISYKVLCLQQRHAGIGIGIGGIGVFSRGALVSVSVSISFFSQILYRLSYRQGKTGIVTSLIHPTLTIFAENARSLNASSEFVDLQGFP